MAYTIINDLPELVEYDNSSYILVTGSNKVSSKITATNLFQYGGINSININYDNTQSQLLALNTQDAIDELDIRLDEIESINYVTEGNSVTLLGGTTGSGSFDANGNISINVVVTNDSHTHDTRYYTETESDDRFVNSTGDSMSGDLTLNTKLISDNIQSLTGGINITSTNTSFSGNVNIIGSAVTGALQVKDKNALIGAVANPTNLTAHGGGIVLKGTTDKTITWSNVDNKWHTNIGLDVSGDISLSGLVDGRDILLDGTKLDTIEENAKDDQLASEVPYSNVTSGLVATDVQNAIDEMESRLDVVETTTVQEGDWVILQGDVSGSAPFDSNGYVTITTTVADDSHNHIISNIDGLQLELDDKYDKTGGTISGDVTISGNLAVNGTTTTVNSTTVTTADNVIVINSGEVGTGVTSGEAGLEVDRGTLTNYKFVFDEVTDSFKIGEIGSLQKVATREDTPLATGIATWDAINTRFITTRAIDVDSITVSGLVDGRDISVDGSKLDTIETNAKDDQLASEVPVTPVGNLTSTNVQAGLEELQSDIDNITAGTTLDGIYVNVTGDTMTGNLTVPNLITGGLVDGRDVSVDGTKLDGIEPGATADQTASEILTLIKTVDGAGSGLDADLLDGMTTVVDALGDTIPTLDTSTTYPQLLVGNDWLRTPNLGLLPDADGSASLGTATWKFNEIHGNTLYEGGSTLASKYLGITSKAADSELLDGLDSTQFARLDALSTFTSSPQIANTAPQLLLNETDTNTVSRIVETASSMYIQSGANGQGTATSSGNIRFSGYNGADVNELSVRLGGVYNTIWHAGNDGLTSTLEAGLAGTTKTWNATTSGGDEHLFISRPRGGEYSEQVNSNVGAIRITLPVLWTNTMMMFWVDVYDYSTNTTMSFQVGGYTPSASTAWTSYSAMQYGGTTKYAVRFGNTATNACIQIGEIGETELDNIKVTVRDFTAGYTVTENQFDSGWSVTRETSLPTKVDATLTNAVWSNLNDGLGSGLDADLLDGFNLDSNATASTVVARDSNADIKAHSFKSSNSTATSLTDGAIVLDGTTGSIVMDNDGGKRIYWNDGGGNFGLRTGNYFNGSEKYTKTGDGATEIEIGSDGNNGNINFRVAPTGTAGNTVSWTHSLVLDTSADVLKLDGNRVLTVADYGSGNGLDADLLDGYHGTTSSTATTVAVRDGSADISARLFRSTYPEQTTAPASTADICFRNSTTDNYMRFMSGTAFVDYCSSLGIGTGGGATGGGSDQVFYENDQVITTNYTITTGKNAMTAGDVTINTGVTVTVPTGSRWVIV